MGRPRPRADPLRRGRGTIHRRPARDRLGARTIGVAFVDTEEGREAPRGAYALARRTGRDFDRVVGEHRVKAEMGARKAVAQVQGSGWMTRAVRHT
jgi:hypothetical protein